VAALPVRNVEFFDANKLSIEKSTGAIFSRKREVFILNDKLKKYFLPDWILEYWAFNLDPEFENPIALNMAFQYSHSMGVL